MGLGLTKLITGDADHIHCELLSKLPFLEKCGGYTLLRLGENSHSLIEIEGPETGITVSFLKDVLNQAKLYVRPLQSDITEDDVKAYTTEVDVSVVTALVYLTCLLYPIL